MKQLLTIVLVLSCMAGWSQKMEPQKRKEYFRMYTNIPGGIGNNVISKANKGKIGFGVAVTFATIDQWHIIGGYELNQFDVTDRSLAGNVDYTNVWQLYLEVLYKIPLNDKFEINPKFSLGDICFAQKSGGTNFGRQYGAALSPGFTVDYRVAGNLRVFAGLNYVLALAQTNTNSAYKSFFGTIHMLNITAGIKL